MERFEADHGSGEGVEGWAGGEAPLVADGQTVALGDPASVRSTSGGTMRMFVPPAFTGYVEPPRSRTFRDLKALLREEAGK